MLRLTIRNPDPKNLGFFPYILGIGLEPEISYERSGGVWILRVSRWWFQTCLFSPHTWGNDPTSDYLGPYKVGPKKPAIRVG